MGHGFWFRREMKRRPYPHVGDILNYEPRNTPYSLKTCIFLNTLLASLSKDLIDRLQMVQNSPARLKSRSRKRDYN